MKVLHGIAILSATGLFMCSSPSPQPSPGGGGASGAATGGSHAAAGSAGAHASGGTVGGDLGLGGDAAASGESGAENAGGGDGGTGGSTGCIIPRFQWLDPPPGWLPGARLYGFSRPVLVSGNGCVLTGVLDSVSQTPTTEAIFRWTESGGFEILSGTAAIGPMGISYDGSKIAALVATHADDTAPPGAVWTRATGWVEAPAGIDPLYMSSDGSTILGLTNGTGAGTIWHNGTSEVVPGLPAAPNGAGNFSVSAHALSGDGLVVAGTTAANAALGVTESVFEWTHANGSTKLTINGTPGSEWPVGLSTHGEIMATNSSVYQLDPTGGDVPLPPTTNMEVVSMSADGSTLVGFELGLSAASGSAIVTSTTLDASKTAAERLTANGLDLTGNALLQAMGVSDDGGVIVGTAGPTPDDGPTRYWLATAAALRDATGGTGGGGGGGGGTGGIGGTGGSGGSGGTMACPETLPTMGSACTAHTPDGCYYAGVGCWCDLTPGSTPSDPTYQWECLGGTGSCASSAPVYGSSSCIAPDSNHQRDCSCSDTSDVCVYAGGLGCSCTGDFIFGHDAWVCNACDEATPPKTGDPSGTTSLCVYPDYQCLGLYIGSWYCVGTPPPI